MGVALGAATAIRLLASPLAGRVGDLVASLRVVLVVCLAAASLAALGYLPASGFALVLPVVLLHAAALSPAGMLSDALALRAGAGKAFEYGRVRGTGSAAFIVGTLVSGQVLAATSLGAIMPMQAALLALAALAALRVPEREHGDDVPAARAPLRAFGVLLRIPAYRNVVIAATLVLGSHALHDAFAVIRWTGAGIGPTAASVLWSEAVIAEVVVFLFLGPRLISLLTPAACIALAAGAGALRWTVMAQTSAIPALALIQPLHGLTFALLHLSCMRILGRVVPHGLEGTAQAVYATIGVGTATALLTFASGVLYAALDARAFLLMAALCLLALPAAWHLRAA